MPNFDSEIRVILSEEKFKVGLQTAAIGRHAVFLPEISSTNDYLARLPLSEAPHGTIVAADLQLAGKGRLGRRWIAPAGSSLLFSTKFCVFEDDADFRPTWLVMLAGVAAVRAIDAMCAVRIGLKWPNDLVVFRQQQLHKLGGILVEVQFESEQITSAIVGMGLNVNIDSAELPPATTPATSLKVILGRSIQREPLLAEIANQMEQLLLEVQAERLDMFAIWREHLVTIGRPVTATGTTVIEGIAETVDEWGRLGIRDVEGALHYVAAGDVTLKTRH